MRNVLRHHYFYSRGEAVLDALTVPLNTSFEELSSELQQTFGGVAIVWNEGSYDGDTAGDYVLTGSAGGAVRCTVSVQAEVTPDLLGDQILWAREDNSNTTTQVDQWTNKYNGSNDLVKITDARRPNVNATGIDGKPSYDFTLANNDVLQTEAGLGLTGDFIAHILFKCTDPTLTSGQFLIQNVENGSFVNTGFVAQVRENEIWVDFRKNDAADQQRIEFAFTDTGWHVLTIKHEANGASSVNIVKLDGVLIKKETGKAAIVHNANKLKTGANSFSTASAFGGSQAEIIINAHYPAKLDEWGTINYLRSRYSDISGIRFLDDNQFKAIDALSEAWNGLASIQRGDSKYDFIGATLTGKVYYFEQGATIDDWTATELADTGLEIQKLKVVGTDSQGRMLLVTAHKDSAVVDDSIGKIMLHRADTTDDNGAYTSVDLITGRAFPQGVVIKDIDDDGENEIIYAYEGTTSGQGGVRWFDCSDFSDVIDPLNWTEHTAIVHESAWWLAGFFTIDGAERLVYSARNNVARNDTPLPGVYYLTPAATITDTWARTTIDNSNLDFGHVDVGNVFGNTSDIIAQNHSNDDVYGYDEGNNFAESTIVTGGTSELGFNLRKLNRTRNGRDIFIHIVENDWCYEVSWDGAAWVRRKLFKTFVHPADNEIFDLDVDNSGFLTVVFDDNTGLANSHIYKFRP